ncbi:MAG: PAS domain-containing sensor histidine kinase [Acidimicrobiales bacterium]|nr:PAS domain-containing sensor histidine kinase [Acidimicrobiales bacterium]
MYSLAEVARVHTGLVAADVDHLHRLVANWGLLADLSFTDLVLFAAADLAEGADARAGRRRYVVLAQVRPTTSQTMHPNDLVGQVFTGSVQPQVERCLRSGETVGPDELLAANDVRASILAIPVRREGRVIGVLTSVGLPSGGRRHGALENAYLTAFSRLARMVALGEFPFPGSEDPLKELPRVGDGVMMLDEGGRVQYCSPNGISALHRLGVVAQVEGATLARLGLDEGVVRMSMAQRRPATQELSRGNHTHVLVHAVPLLERKAVVGVLAVLRDISDVRRLDRLLVSKDTHIREIHHRVKNNLQTISSLLRIQARRVSSAEAREAIEESVRRIASIAVVHETLSREAGDDVPFTDIARPIIRMVEESLMAPERAVLFRLVGDAPTLPADVATPLALVLTELLQNTVDHAYHQSPSAEGSGESGGAAPVDSGEVIVTVTGPYDVDGAARVRVGVLDDGAGLAEGFSLDGSTGLGLSIVRTLVEHELEGTISVRGRDDGRTGTEVVVEVPLVRDHD